LLLILEVLATSDCSYACWKRLSAVEPVWGWLLSSSYKTYKWHKKARGCLI